jgi:hypothetical protein
MTRIPDRYSRERLMTCACRICVGFFGSVKIQIGAQDTTEGYDVNTTAPKTRHRSFWASQSDSYPP